MKNQSIGDVLFGLVSLIIIIGLVYVVLHWKQLSHPTPKPIQNMSSSAQEEIFNEVVGTSTDN